MKTITFMDTDEIFNVMAEDERYIIAVRPYTIQERDSEIKEWNKTIEEALKEEWESDTKQCFDYEEFCEDSVIAENLREYVIDEIGRCPEELSEDTFAYTIIDLVEKIRGADNYGCKFDYDKKEECEKALKELNTITDISKDTPCPECEMKISHRNKVELKLKEPYINGFEPEA